MRLHIIINRCNHVYSEAKIARTEIEKLVSTLYKYEHTHIHTDRQTPKHNTCTHKYI